MIDLEHAQGFQRVLLLNECLHLISQSKDFQKVSTQDLNPHAYQDSKINQVFQFTTDNFRESIALSDVAAFVHMSIPAVCQYFKRSTKKTHIDFLNEVRTGYACHLLMETESRCWISVTSPDIIRWRTSTSSI